MANHELFNNNHEYQSMCLRAFDIEQQIEKLQKEHSELLTKIGEIEINYYNKCQHCKKDLVEIDSTLRMPEWICGSDWVKRFYCNKCFKTWEI